MSAILVIFKVKSMKIMIMSLLTTVLILSSFALGQQNISLSKIVPGSFLLEGMPAHVSTQTSVQSHSDSLKSAHSLTRIYTAIRLGQLGDAASISHLKAAFDAEPISETSMDRGNNGLRYYTLLAIGVIGGSEAEKILCDMGENWFFGSEDLRWAGGDLIFIRGGIIDGLSMTKSACADSLLSKLIAWYEEKGQPSATAALAYAARNRLRLKQDESREKIAALLDSMRAAEISIKRQKAEVSTPDDNTQKSIANLIARIHGFQINAAEIGRAYPELLREYIASIPVEEPLYAKLSDLMESIDNKRLQNEK